MIEYVSNLQNMVTNRIELISCPPLCPPLEEGHGVLETARPILGSILVLSLQNGSLELNLAISPDLLKFFTSTALSFSNPPPSPQLCNVRGGEVGGGA